MPPESSFLVGVYGELENEIDNLGNLEDMINICVSWLAGRLWVEESFRRRREAVGGPEWGEGHRGATLLPPLRPLPRLQRLSPPLGGGGV